MLDYVRVINFRIIIIIIKQCVADAGAAPASGFYSSAILPRSIDLCMFVRKIYSCG